MAPDASPDEMAQRVPRQHVLLGAEICRMDGSPQSKHRIKDLSASGARVDHAGMLTPGSTVSISVGILEAVGATVVWVKDDVAGLRFAEPIDPDAARSKAFIPAASRPALVLKPATVRSDEAAGPRASAGWIGDMRNRHQP